MLKVLADSANRDHWLEVRKATVGASEAWKLICEPHEPGRDLLGELRMEKAGLADPFEETEPMRIGREFERAAFESFVSRDLAGWGATWFGVMLGDLECGALSATPDAIVWNHPDAPGVPIPLDVKVGGRAWAPRKDQVFQALSDAGVEHHHTTLKAVQADEALWDIVMSMVSVVPEYVQVQLQVQCAVLGAPFAMTARTQLEGSGLGQRLITVQRHDGLIAKIRQAATDVMAEVQQLKGAAE